MEIDCTHKIFDMNLTRLSTLTCFVSKCSISAREWVCLLYIPSHTRNFVHAHIQEILLFTVVYSVFIFTLLILSMYIYMHAKCSLLHATFLVLPPLLQRICQLLSDIEGTSFDRGQSATIISQSACEIIKATAQVKQLALVSYHSH